LVFERERGIWPFRAIPAVSRPAARSRKWGKGTGHSGVRAICKTLYAIRIKGFSATPKDEAPGSYAEGFKTLESAEPS
jgi:hypothetical protein